MKRGHWLAALTALCCGAAGAAQNVTRLDAALAARIDGAPLYALSVDSLCRAAREQTSGASCAASLQTAIANRLLAAAARRDFKDLQGSNRVAFERDVALDDKLGALLRAQFGAELEAALKALPGGTLNGLISAQNPLDAALWERIFGQPGKLQLTYSLDAQQVALAKKTVLLRYSLQPGQSAAITLYDVYRRQNVQGRLELYQHNVTFLQQQTQLTLAGLFELHWAAHTFGAHALADLRLALDDQDQVQALLALHGIGADIEDEGVLLERMARQVSRAEIAAYYRQHKDEFTRIEKVKARHIRLPDEASGNAVLAAAAKGETFAALARRYSQADDAQAGGDLGWIVHEGKLDWLAQLAFMQPEGQVSRPFRTAVAPNQAAQWEIVLVEQRVQGYQAPDSEAVAYAARHAVAREKAGAQILALRERLLRQARIEINGDLPDIPAAVRS
ncbi:parvulin-like peptidyl-prolyl isomerase [Oxalobacteraceae bacterium GrIS 1.11]